MSSHQARDPECFADSIPQNPHTIFRPDLIDCNGASDVPSLILRTGFQFGSVKVFLADHMHAGSRIRHKLSFLRLYGGCGGQNPLIGRRTACIFFRFFELKDILGKFPRVSAGASLLSFGLFLRSVLKFHGVGTALKRTFDLDFSQATDLSFLDAVHPSRIVLVELIPAPLCPSEKSIQMLAAQRPVIRNPTGVHFFTIATALLSPPSSASCWVVPQQSRAEMGTLRRIYIPFPTFQTDLREDANTHNAIWCKYLSRSIYLPLILFLDALLPLGVGGSEDGAAFDVGFARS